jgi:hypothetical protein
VFALQAVFLAAATLLYLTARDPLYDQRGSDDRR